jgi:hypothetical protein
MRESSVDLQNLRKSFTPFIEAMDGDERLPGASLRDHPGVVQPGKRAVQHARDALAIWLRDDAPDGVLTPQMALQHRLARQGLSNCRLMSPAWVDIIDDLMRMTAPFLAGSDMRALVERLSSSKCVAALGERERMRLRYFAATALRDYASVAQVTEAMLSSQERWPPVDAAEYVRAGAAARLALGKPGEARDFWMRHRARLVGAQRLLIARLVAAHLPGVRPEAVPIEPEPSPIPRTPR